MKRKVMAVPRKVFTRMTGTSFLFFDKLQFIKGKREGMRSARERFLASNGWKMLTVEADLHLHLVGQPVIDG